MGLENVTCAGLMEHLQTHPQAYDVVVLSHVVEHLTKRELLEALRLTRAALVPGGQALLLTPNAASPFGFLYAVSDFTHELLLTATSLSQVAAATGFEIVYLGGVRPPRTSVRGWLKAAAWASVRPVLARALGDRRLPFGTVVEPELIGAFRRPLA